MYKQMTAFGYGYGAVTRTAKCIGMRMSTSTSIGVGRLQALSRKTVNYTTQLAMNKA